VVIETNRGHQLGRLIYRGSPQPDTGIPGKVGGKQAQRVLRAPDSGILTVHASIGDRLEEGQTIFEVEGYALKAPFRGVLRGMLHPGSRVKKGQKIGDIDPRDDPSYCTTISDKSRALGGSVLEAILSVPGLRRELWGGT
jgi:xanthine dehydrogenase accessory factor